MSNNLPHSEQMRQAGDKWVKLDAAARLLEEGKTTYLAQQMALKGDIAVSKAEREVKASPQWSEYIKNMVNAKTAANEAKMELEFIKTQYWEFQNHNANNRAERRM